MSLRIKFTIFAIIILALFIGIILATNNLLLEKYYISSNRDSFMFVYKTLFPAGTRTQESIAPTVDRLRMDTGYKIMIVDRDGMARYSSVPEFKPGDRLDLPRDQKEYFLKNRERLDKGEVIYEAIDNSPNGQSVLQLTGKLEGNDFLVVTQPLYELRKNVKIATSFFFWIGLGTLLAFSFVVMLSASRVIRPVLTITDIAASIARLDFSRRYIGKSRDELGTLGTSINTISERLSTAIEELKGTNVQLQNEIQTQKRFIASVYHDFKTPVGLIRGYAESLLLGLGKTKQEADEHAAIIIREADRLDRLVNDVIYMMRMETNKIRFRFQPENAADIVHEAMERVESEAEKLLIKTIVSIEKECGETLVLADRERIVQVLDNLLSNALHHTTADGRIELGARVSDAMMRITVFNTGEHIAEEHLERIFTPFYRVDDSRSRNAGGSGLGLAIVQGIVTAHSGTCGVANAEGGVLFWFTLRIASSARSVDTGNPDLKTGEAGASL
jgi:signal transduction histidine kinase